jgi:hypothetical protein
MVSDILIALAIAVAAITALIVVVRIDQATLGPVVLTLSGAILVWAQGRNREK